MGKLVCGYVFMHLGNKPSLIHVLLNETDKVFSFLLYLCEQILSFSKVHAYRNYQNAYWFWANLLIIFKCLSAIINGLKVAEK